MFSTEEIAQNKEILDRLIENDRSIKKTLLRKGYTFQSHRPTLESRLLIDSKNPDLFDSLYNLMADNNRRNILKKVCSLKKDIDLKELCEGWSENKYNEFRRILVQINILKQDGKRHSLVKFDSDFGINFEWYVAELFRRELYCTSDWGVHIEESPEGGDYDVIARSDAEIIYVECKAKRIKNITEKETIYFFLRDEFLRPNIPILLIDTTDDIGEFETLLNSIIDKTKTKQKKYGRQKDVLIGEGPFLRPTDSQHIKCFAGRVFICNIEDGVLKTIKACLRHHHRLTEMEKPWKPYWLQELLLNICQKEKVPKKALGNTWE